MLDSLASRPLDKKTTDRSRGTGRWVLRVVQSRSLQESEDSGSLATTGETSEAEEGQGAGGRNTGDNEVAGGG